MTIGENTRLIPVTKWPNYHTWPTVSGLRHLIFWERENGFHKVIFRVGKRIIIDESAFFEWVKEQKYKQENDYTLQIVLKNMVSQLMKMN